MTKLQMYSMANLAAFIAYKMEAISTIYLCALVFALFIDLLIPHD